MYYIYIMTKAINGEINERPTKKRKKNDYIHIFSYVSVHLVVVTRIVSLWRWTQSLEMSRAVF